jgi:large subunit ribosomal protein L25
MKLKISNRVKGPEGALGKLRREGKIPAVLYRAGEAVRPIIVDNAEFQAALRQIPQGGLATTIFELELDGKKIQALVKEVQYHPITYAVIHIDLMAVMAQESVRVRVPLRCTGVAECAGVRLGGMLREVRRSVPVSAPIGGIPEVLTVDVTALGIGKNCRLRDVQFPAGVKPLLDLNEVVVVVAKR